MIQLFKNLEKSNYYDIIVGVTTMLLIFAMKFGKRKLESNENVPKPVQKIAWFFGTARNAIVVILFTLISLGVNYSYIDEWKAGCPGSSPGTVFIGFLIPYLSFDVIHLWRI